LNTYLRSLGSRPRRASSAAVMRSSSIMLPSLDGLRPVLAPACHTKAGRPPLARPLDSRTSACDAPRMTIRETIAILGCGTMGEAILGGRLATGHVAAGQVVASVRRPERARALEARYGIRAFADNEPAAREADVAILAVKPQVAARVLT